MNWGRTGRGGPGSCFTERPAGLVPPTLLPTREAALQLQRYHLGPPTYLSVLFACCSVKGKYKLHLHIMEYFEKNVLYYKRFKTAWYMDFS